MKSRNLKKKEKFDESTLNSDLQELSGEATISGFNEMSKSIRDEQAQTIEDTRWGKDDDGWGVDDDW